MVIGVGADLVSIPRMRRALTRWQDRLVQRLYTPQEVRECDGRLQPEVHFASRFAAKEAVLKALGTGWGEGIAWREVEVVGGQGRPPEIRLRGRAEEVARQRGIRRALLSLSHEGEYALAFVIATD